MLWRYLSLSAHNIFTNKQPGEIYDKHWPKLKGNKTKMSHFGKKEGIPKITEKLINYFFL